MNYSDWYTDRMTVYRAEAVLEGGLTRQRRVLAGEEIPCRRYRLGSPQLEPGQTAAAVRQSDYVQCGNEADVRAGDLLEIRGPGGEVLRAWAGEPVRFYEPFGAVLPGLAHQEIPIREEEMVP